MESIDAFNSTSYESVVNIVSAPIIDNTHGLINVLQQTQYEEGQANKGLKASIFMHSFVIISTLAIIVLDMTLADSYKRDNPYSMNIRFALLSFSLKLGNHVQKFKYDCLHKSDPEKFIDSIDTMCTISEKCLNENIGMYLDVDDYGMTCDDFSEYSIIGLIVRINQIIYLLLVFNIFDFRNFFRVFFLYI